MDRREVARARARMQAAVREFLTRREFDEVETPCLVPEPAMEPHIDAFRAPFVPEGGGAARPLWLHSSPEYAMKRLLAEGFPRIFQLARVFRNGEVSDTHNPEFTLLEMYRAHTDYRGIMEDLEETVAACARAVTGGTRISVGGRPLELAPPFERLTAQEAFQTRAGVDLAACDGRADRLRAALRERGLGVAGDGDSFDDLYFRVFLEVVEPTLGLGRPTYLVDWPAPMAALSRLKPGDPRVAERFELYAGGLELANGFSELTDAAEQRRRLMEEQGLRARLGRPVYPLDERFLAALPRMPEAGGVALGLDRLLMLLVGARTIDEVLLFPAREFLAPR
ncbi:EF-P lysine aminoacylase EpmA [Anaeromyxobacter diazotrophicus]|uniref:EF-P lysine aminoacylase GenX n=1 Tax=Anaeromyxobacter diazotrophicus TaxID=2590199 RepID=A0A7I9VKA6_9BACT|nr:EF-P lysine aminoacylase EpmA [Anaeromyxobacter diazotrophicus]GEJ56823.1 EF-P lysine aminoacylase GenX [Anaeromyxobacter diazotrophicus]